MDNAWVREETIIREAEHLLAAGAFSSEQDALRFRDLLAEYRVLLRRHINVVRMNDIVHPEPGRGSGKPDTGSSMDEVTGLYNRGSFNVDFQREWTSAMRTRLPLSLLMIELEGFRDYIDRYGSSRGDECLKAAASVIRSSVKRPRDIVSRSTGEQFMVLLPETGTDGALRVARGIQSGIEAMGIGLSREPGIPVVTASIGAASAVPVPDLPTAALLLRADSALYDAKKSGRNCVRIFEEILDSESSFPETIL